MVSMHCPFLHSLFQSKHALDFEILSVDPAIERDHIHLEKKGAKRAIVSCIKPFDREKLVHTFPEDIESSEDGVAAKLSIIVGKACMRWMHVCDL